MHWKHWLEKRFVDRQEQGLWRERHTLESPQAARIVVDGRELVNFCSNDYLGLANHDRLRQAAAEAVQAWGCGSGASHLICGHSELHEQLETELARFVGAERALLFSTGYLANLAIPQTFLQRNDLLVTDKLNHASLIDAAQLIKPQVVELRYPHGDWAKADSNLHQPAERKLLMTDGVFSMDGDLAPLPQLSTSCQRQSGLLVVDDAHGFGVMGKRGSGSLEHFQIPVREHVMMMGTLGKAAGGFGAFVAGDRHLIEALIQFARSYIYTTALPPVAAAMGLAALEVFRDDPERRNRLCRNIQHFRHLARVHDIRLGAFESAIQPIYPRSPESSQSRTEKTQRVIQISQGLLDAGFWVLPIRPPTVPVGSDRLRVTITSEHRLDEIERLVEAIALISRKTEGWEA
jgi:8-amino-7-oxononanoate synthase